MFFVFINSYTYTFIPGGNENESDIWKSEGKNAKNRKSRKSGNFPQTPLNFLLNTVHGRKKEKEELFFLNLQFFLQLKDIKATTE